MAFPYHLPTTDFCYKYISQGDQSSFSELINHTKLYPNSLGEFCSNVTNYESNSETEGMYGSPMVLIGIYISIASLFCIFAMGLDLLNGLRIRKFWFPTKYFSLNAASITVIAVAMKLPVDLTSPMPGQMDQFGKFASLAFMFTMMCNLMPSLASMDNKSLLANITGLSILVITLIVNTFIQIRTHVIGLYAPNDDPGTVMVASMYMGMLLFLLIILISSATTIPTSKKFLEIKYQAISKTILIDQHQQENLRQVVKRYWIMAETSSPQFVMANSPLSSASSIICAISMLMYMLVAGLIVLSEGYLSLLAECKSVYKRSMIAIVVTQSIGVVVGSIAPIFRCFTIFSFKSFSKQNRNHFMVFKVDKYWTQMLSEWKESHISILSSGRKSKALLHNSKNCVLGFCIGFQKVVVVSCKIIGLLPIVVVIPSVYFASYLNSLKRMLCNTSTASSSVDKNEDLNKYVLLLEDNMQLAKNTVKGISDSMNRLILKAEKKQHKNLLKLLEQSVGEHDASNGVVVFDNDQFQSQLSIGHVNSWSLPIISLTCITIALSNIEKDRVDNLFKSVGEGLLYTHQVEEILNRESVYVNIRRATLTLWHEVEVNYKWLKKTLERSAYVGKTPTQVIKSFSDIAEEILKEFNKSTNGELIEKENLPPKVIAANSMYRIAKTIIHAYERNNSYITEDELFTQLCGIIADILAACFTNIPRAISMRCHESTIEKREVRVAAAIDLFGRTTKITERLETRELPSMDQNKMAYIDEWRHHLRHP